MTEIALYSMFLTSFACLFFYSGFYFVFFRKKKNEQKNNISPSAKSAKLSILIAAKNEEENLPNLFAALAEQKLQNFEIILVCDRCTDKSADIAREFSEKLPLMVLEIFKKNEKKDGKKNALAIGIEAACGEIILLTDADCVPASPFWANMMREETEKNEADVLIGVSPFLQRNDFWGQFFFYENLKTMCEYIFWAATGAPYMCVGRNWVFRKEIFHRCGGFDGTAELTGGDDDLLLQKMLKSGAKFAVITDKNAATFTAAKSGLKSWLRQKQRHLGVGFHYGKSEKVYANLVNFLESLLILQVIFLTLQDEYSLAAGLVFGLKTIFKALIFRKIARKYGIKFWAYGLVIFEGLFVFYLFFFGFFSKIRKNKKWK